MFMTERGGRSFAKLLNAEAGYLTSEIQRQLPPDFVERTSHNLSDEVEVKVRWGSSWMIPLVRNEIGEVFFEKQKWCEFVVDNCLTEAAYTLTFSHQRDNCLYVTIFGEDHVEIMESPQPLSCCTSPADSI